MAIDPKTPVIIGAGQLSLRPEEGDPEAEPVELMAMAVDRAFGDSGVDGASILSAVDSIRTVLSLSWRYSDPGRAVLGRLGASAPADIDSAVIHSGGNSPQSLLNLTALDIQSGATRCAVLVGAEAWRLRAKYVRAGGKPPWTLASADDTTARSIGGGLDMGCDAETSQGVVMPVNAYPMIEHAIRHRLGRDIESHTRAIAELWARFSDVAAGNPHAWIREPMTAEQVATVTPENRMVGFPYTKAMNSNDMVNQGAAVVICSVAEAERLGVSRSRWVFPLAGTDAADRYLSNRDALSRCPAVGIAGRTALELAGTDVGSVAHLDLYSCFPSAVEIGAEELGIDLDRQLTVTGGLRFAGGPWNNYVMHAIATMVEVLRADPGSTGLVWGNGGFLSKHAFGLYSTRPPTGGFRHADVQEAVDALPGRQVSTDHEGPATVETWTVMHDRDSRPEVALFSLLLDDGRRAWGRSTDQDTCRAGVTRDLIGTVVHRAADGTVTL